MTRDLSHAPAANPAPRSADALVDELKAVLQSAPPKEREALLAKLSAVGLAGGSGGALSLSPLTLKMLGIPEGAAVDVNRLAPLFSALIEFVVKLDDTAWGVWKGFGKDARTLKREAPMRGLIKTMLRGNTKLTARQVEFQIANLMRLTVELLGQISKVGLHASRFLRRFAPAQIEAEVQAQRSKMSLKGVETQCWELHSDKWADVDAGLQRAINKEIGKIVAVTVNIQRLPA